MFRTHSMGRTKVPLNADKDVIAIRLKLPDTVERCQRRQFYRVSTVGLALPKVEAHPLLDPLSAIPAETVPEGGQLGPGRAGGGEELGAERGMVFYMQRCAVQGFKSVVEESFAS